MTTQCDNLVGRIPAGPIRVQRADKTTYMEGNAEEVLRMIKARIVEGVGPRSGRIDILRITCTADEAVKRMSAIAVEAKPEESAGSITSQASREIYREKLEDGVHWCWQFKRNRNVFATA